jgi:hypothetical protein
VHFEHESDDLDRFVKALQIIATDASTQINALQAQVATLVSQVSSLQTHQGNIIGNLNTVEDVLVDFAQAIQVSPTGTDPTSLSSPPVFVTDKKRSTDSGATMSVDSFLSKLEARKRQTDEGSCATVLVQGNVRIINGPRFTAPNGCGNFIVGSDTPLSAISGAASHNVIVSSNVNATAHTVSGFSNLVLGADNTVAGQFGIVAGFANTQNNWACAAVLGGEGNLVDNSFAVVVNGLSNTANGESATVVAGSNNVASGVQAVIATGNENQASGQGAVILTG